jgi:hypothetical protein
MANWIKVSVGRINLDQVAAVRDDGATLHLLSMTGTPLIAPLGTSDRKVVLEAIDGPTGDIPVAFAGPEIVR